MSEKLITDSEKTLLRQLKDPLNPDFVKWRVGATNKEKTKGIALAYIDSREVMKRFDELLGMSNWRKRLIETKDGFICEIDIKVNGEWVTRSDAAGNTKVESIKGGASDAFKRAAANWGIGRYLYYLPNVWVGIKARGNSYELAEIPELPNWAKPNKTLGDWEAVAEEEIKNARSSDDQEFGESVISNLDQVRNFTDKKKLEAFVETLDDAEKRILATEVNRKRLELNEDGPRTK